MEYTKMVSTKLEKIDKNEVAKKCLVRKNWSKVWTIVEYEGFTIVARLAKIDTKNGLGEIELTGTFIPKKGDTRTGVSGEDLACFQGSSFEFPLFRKDFTQKAFNDKLVTTADNLLSNSFADFTIRSTPRYKMAEALDARTEELSKKVAKTYCEKHNVFEEDLQDAVQRELFVKYNKSRGIKVELEFEKYIFPDVLYALSCWLGLEDKQKVYKELMRTDWKEGLSDTNFELSADEKEGEESEGESDSEDEDEDSVASSINTSTLALQ